MKKALSVFLAIMMLFGALSVGASATDTYLQNSTGPSPFHEINNGPVHMDQAVCYFKLNGGTLKGPVQVYTTGNGISAWTTAENVTGAYWMLPHNELAGGENTFTEGWRVVLPVVTAPAGYQFDGWYCMETGDTYAANGTYRIRSTDVGQYVRFEAAFSPVDVSDGSSNAINILTKVFGTILGIFIYSGDVDKGIAFVSKILGSIFS